MNTHQRNVAAAKADAGTRETHELIASDKVEGTNVYRSNGDKVGASNSTMRRSVEPPNVQCDRADIGRA